MQDVFILLFFALCLFRKLVCYVVWFGASSVDQLCQCLVLA